MILQICNCSETCSAQLHRFIILRRLCMKTEAIIFDLDGTLWDATHGILKTWNIALEQNGNIREPVSYEEKIEIRKKELEDENMILKKNVDLSKKTTFHVGGIAKNYYIPENSDEMLEILCKLKDTDFKIISGGSNILINDKIEMCGVSLR